MKKNVITLFFVMLISFTSISQTLLDTSKMWVNIWGTYGTGGPPPYWMLTETFKIGKDTLIKSVWYKELLLSTDPMFSQWNMYCYIRETQDEKVYYIFNVADTVEKLCYDFNVQTGDTIIIYQIWYIYTLPATLIVYYVDSTNFAGQYRKRIWFSGENWYSGVGSDKGFVFSGSGMIVGTLFQLNCYFENDTLKYQNPSWPTCYMIYPEIDEFIRDSAGKMNIYPNPAIDCFHISLHQSHSNPINSNNNLKKVGYCIQVYNTFGRIVYETYLKPGQQEIEIAVGSWSSGLFLVKLVKEGQTIGFGKVIVSPL